MANLTYLKPERVWIKGHPELTERWVQDVIADDPTVLGLGDLILKDKERAQPHAGRLDLLLQDSDAARRYEVEIQLGKTDESHVIRSMAIRELLMNAVMHRDYESNAPIRFYWFSDRIEIQNPGGLYGAVTPETFPNQNDYRNPKIAEAMKTLGYVNRFGRGIARAQRFLEENGNPQAEFDVTQATFFLATIREVPA
jgi:hypothetical protein